jgi:iron(II)-dependent oxidoreductase
MEEEFSGFSILDDQPTLHDALDFAAYRDALVGIVRDPETRTPLVIGVYGTWGSGKTSLMRQVEDELTKEAPEGERLIRTMWFDAWKYHREEVVWRALLLQVLDCLEKEDLSGKDKQKIGLSEKDKQQIADWKQRLYEDVDRETLGDFTFEVTKAGKGVLKLGLGLLPGLDWLRQLLTGWESDPSTFVEDLSAAVGRQKTRVHERKVEFLEEFQRGLAHLVQEYAESRGGRMVVFVDDLDRCLKGRALEVLEAIKLFLDVKGCVFVLGLDREAILEAVQTRYDDEEKSRQYLEKIVQLPFLLPPIEADDMAGFVEELVPQLPLRCREVFTLGLKPNPRQVKRTINVFLFLWKLSRQKLGEQIAPVRLAKVVVIQHSYPGLYDVLVDTPRYLKELEEYFRAEAPRAAERRPPLEEEAPAAPSLPPSLQPFTGMGMLRKLLTMHPAEGPESEGANFIDLTPQEIRPYIYLTRRTAPEPAVKGARPFVEPQMVEVPEGQFLMGSTAAEVDALGRYGPDLKEWAANEKLQRSVPLPAYEIGRYPVTNVEYRAFVRDTNHRPPRHWEGDAYPHGLGDHPVVYVSWHDARAYCAWLREKTKRPYRLPTEAQWEKAARGTEGQVYPWGDGFEATRCNSAEGGVRGTTPVGQYSPQGDSPYGLADMAGNVWEWTSTLYRDYPCDAEDGREEEEESGPRVVRGGTFYSYQGVVRCAYRSRHDPDYRDLSLGFRVVVFPGSPSLF